VSTFPPSTGLSLFSGRLGGCKRRFWKLNQLHGAESALEKLIISHTVKKCPSYTGTICSLPYSQQPTSKLPPHSQFSDYELDDRGSIPGRGKGFLFQPLYPERLWGPPSLLFNGYRGPFFGGKARPGRDADHSPPSSAELKKEEELYFHFPQAPPWCVAGQLYFTSYEAHFIFIHPHFASSIRKPFEVFRKMVLIFGEKLQSSCHAQSGRPPIFGCPHCFFNIFATTLHIWMSSS
jgi:hypothetical protein